MSSGLESLHPRMYESAEAAAQFYKEAAEAYLHNLPGDCADVNVRRAEEFVKSKGYQVSPYVITTKELYNEHRAQLDQYPYLSPPLNDGYWAWFVPSYRVATVLRRPDLESFNGVVFTESALVHELTHSGDQMHDLQAIDYEGVVLYAELESGMRQYSEDGLKGELLDEMVADYHRQDYIKRFSRLGIYPESVGTVSHWPTLHLDGTIPIEIPLYPFARYLQQNPNVDDGHTQIVDHFKDIPVVTRNSLIAGSSLRLMTMADPEIKQILENGLQTNELKEEFAERINSIRSGLYDELLSLGPEKTDTMQAAELVWGAVKKLILN